MKNRIKISFLWLLSFTLLFGQLNAASVVPASNNNNPTTPATPAPKVNIKAALNDFKSLSKQERKLRIKEAKKELKAYKQQKKNGEPSDNKILLIILAILLPPLAVYLHQGEINSKFWISLLLTLLFWIPGVIYALLVVTGEID
jgi:uncharacterized membrane protein YqaE (UPF0057 family)